MADITMCTQTLCPNAPHCYRVQAKPSDWQYWDRFEWSEGPDGVTCPHYLPSKAMENLEKIDTVGLSQENDA